MNTQTIDGINQVIYTIQEQLNIIKKILQNDSEQTVTIRSVVYDLKKDTLTVYFEEIEITHRFYHFIQNTRVSNIFCKLYLTPFNATFESVDTLDFLKGEKFQISTFVNKEGYINIGNVSHIEKIN